METNQAAPKSPGLSGADSQFLQSSLLMMANAQGERPTGPPGLSATPTLSALVQALKRRWMLALTVALVASVGTVFGVFQLLPPKYNVQMRVRVARQAGVEESNHFIFTANMEAMVKSPLVLNAALNEKTKDGRDIKDLELVRSKGMGVIEWMEKALKTDFKLGPEVLRVTLAADQPEEAAELLNAVARAFLHEYAEMERAKKQQRLVELRARKEIVEADLSSLRKLWESQMKTLDVKDREAMQVTQQQWLNKLGAAEASRRINEEEYIKADNEIVVASARLKSLDKHEVPDDVLYEEYLKDPTIQGYIKAIGDLEDAIARMYREYNEPFATQKAVPLKHAKIEVTDLKAAREKQIRPAITLRWRTAVRKILETQISVAEEKREGFLRRRESFVKETLELERKVKESGPGGKARPRIIQETEDKIELAKKALEQTSAKISEVDLEVPGSRIQLLERAAVPLDRDRSQQTKIAGAGGLGIFVVALFGVAFLEFRSRKIGEADEVASGLGLKVLGTVPAMPVRPKKAGQSNSAGEQLWHNQLQESMDAIRTVLLHQARTEALHVIMIASANSGEGKTTLATQLAASLARAWKRTLVIDGDLRHPGAHLLFDVPQEPGLAEVLRGEVEPGDAVRATPFSRLWVLPAGNGDAHAIQAMAQDNLRTLFEQFKQQYDFIIIDAPPVLPVTDALLLGQHVDGILFTVLREVSRAPAIHAAQQKLEPLGVPTLGAVVLGTEPEFTDQNYRFAVNSFAKQ
ncbi:MAG: polysaccharide biosynthesis tyrosine autokinase [Planctomycetes bacterium]|nr:polysaccharide biosynthesis tyrosine autokinase [Planctomycetota bacterium]